MSGSDDRQADRWGDEQVALMQLGLSEEFADFLLFRFGISLCSIARAKAEFYSNGLMGEPLHGFMFGFLTGWQESNDCMFGVAAILGAEQRGQRAQKNGADASQPAGSDGGKPPPSPPPTIKGGSADATPSESEA